MQKLRWGIMGSGRIVRRWINGAKQISDMEVTAIAGRTQSPVDKCAEDFGIPERYYSYEQLVKSENVDICYVAGVHTVHKEHAMLAMEHGKHVLVEKPISVSAADVREMMACAERNNVFLMEAVWTRFFPLTVKLRELLSSGAVGDVRMVNAAFSSRVPVLPQTMSGRIFDPVQGGGGLLDVGVYPLHFADMVLAVPPVELSGFSAVDSDENHLMVDEQAVFIARYPGGRLASMACGVRTNMPDSATIYAEEAMIVLPTFWKPTKMEIIRPGQETEIIECPVESPNPDYTDEGFQYEIRHVNECVRNGIIKSQVLPWEKSLMVMEQCDSLRKKWGLASN